jgi:hypothetical protein
MSDLETTCLSLHAVAELLLAGPQFEQSKSIELRVTPGGFATVTAPDVRVKGAVLRLGDRLVTLSGRTVAEVASDAGLVARPLDDVYSGGCGLTAEHPLLVDDASATEIAEGFRLGEEAMTAFAPAAHRVLWPEHFDLGITLGEVNYGLSPGDSYLGVPYAYVGPWKPSSYTGTFWNAPFGAARPVSDLGTTEAVLAFFRAGQTQTG